MSHTWTCLMCPDEPSTGTEPTEQLAARAFLSHYTTAHPDPIAAWNTAMNR